MVLVSPADADGSLDAEVLRLRHRRLGLTLVLPHGLHRPDRARRRPLPQERRGPVVHLFLERVLTRWRAAAPSEARVAAVRGRYPAPGRKEKDAPLRRSVFSCSSGPRASGSLMNP